jgi:predicted MFS family arabinose efflux permease
MTHHEITFTPDGIAGLASKDQTTAPKDDAVHSPAAWGSVVSMALCVAVLIASEFLPVSLLSPIAGDLGVTEGHMGQAISISGIFAVITSLFVSSVTRRLDRRLVVTFLSLLLVVSGSIVTVAPNYVVLMMGRALLGVAIGGFWSMSTAIVMRLVPEDSVPKGLAMLNAGNAIAATISAPLGSLLGSYVGWRGAFFAVVPLALLALLWQWISLPPLPPRRKEGSPNVLRLLARPQVAMGMASVMLLFMGQFALFTYLRPFLETVTEVSISMLSLLLLLMGRRCRNLLRQRSASDAVVQNPGIDPPRDGSDRTPVDRVRRIVCRDCGSPGRLGFVRHGCPGRLGHLAQQNHA